MFEQLDMKKVLLILILLIAVAYLVFFVFLPYEEFQRCKREGCPFNLEQEWKDLNCPFELSKSLVYSVDIINSPDGSVANFTCEFGNMYEVVNATRSRVVIQNCSRETVELINLAVRGRKENLPYGLYYPIPDSFKDYTYVVLACDTYTTGPHAGRYLSILFVNHSGVLYP